MQHLWNANSTTSQQKRKPTPTGTQIINQFVKLLSSMERNAQAEPVHTQKQTLSTSLNIGGRNDEQGGILFLSHIFSVLSRWFFYQTNFWVPNYFSFIFESFCVITLFQFTVTILHSYKHYMPDPYCLCVEELKDLSKTAPVIILKFLTLSCHLLPAGIKEAKNLNYCSSNCFYLQHEMVLPHLRN